MERMESGKYDNAFRILLLALAVAAAGFIVRGGARLVSSGRVLTQKERPCVVIDAGHGGADPGKVGVDGSLEKDINLQIGRAHV